MAENEIIPVSPSEIIQQKVNGIDNKITALSNEISKGDFPAEQLIEKINELNTLSKIKSQLRYANMNQKYDDILQAVLDRFDNDYPTFSNKELLEYATQIQNIMNNTRLATKDEEMTTPMLQQNNNVNVTVGDSLDRASKERVADVVKGILKAINNDKGESFTEDSYEV